GLVKTVAEVLVGTNADARTGVPPSVPGSVRLPPPQLDEHGDAIRTLGWRAFGCLQILSAACFRPSLRAGFHPCGQVMKRNRSLAAGALALVSLASIIDDRTT